MSHVLGSNPRDGVIYQKIKKSKIKMSLVWTYYSLLAGHIIYTVNLHLSDSLETNIFNI